LLHAVLVVVFARATVTPPAEARIAEERTELRVSVVMRAPLTTPEPAEPGLERAPEPAADQTLAEEAVELPAVDDTARAQPDALSAAEVDAGENSGSTAAWTPSTVRAAVSGYIRSQRDAAIEAWVVACSIERKSEHTRDCKAQRGGSEGRSASSEAGRDVVAGTVAAMTRKWRDAQLTAELEVRKVSIDALMDEEGPVGQLAADRYYLDAEIVRYLNGNPSPYGPRNQFICGKRIAGTGVRRPVPCVYEYTGFVIVAPEQPVDPNAFRVAPTLLGTAR
jgi:hypothetical protein